MNTGPLGNFADISTTTSSKKVIYDFGANNGDDIPYYLQKADFVVAVEANPSLCRNIEERFSAAIQEGRLRVENCVLVGEGNNAEVYFYLHKRRHVLSQFPQPDESVIAHYNKVLLPSQAVMDILEKYGEPYYIKIDIEHYEKVILRELFENGVRPPFISAESTSIQVFALLAALGEYKAFKLVEGATVAKKYKNHSISVTGGSELYSFPAQSAGPFGDDIVGEWMNDDDLFDVLAAKRMGWRDIHATTLVQPDPTSHIEKRQYLRRHVRGWILAKLRSLPKKNWRFSSFDKQASEFPSMVGGREVSVEGVHNHCNMLPLAVISGRCDQQFAARCRLPEPINLSAGVGDFALNQMSRCGTWTNSGGSLRLFDRFLRSGVAPYTDRY